MIEIESHLTEYEIIIEQGTSQPENYQKIIEYPQNKIWITITDQYGSQFQTLSVYRNQLGITYLQIQDLSYFKLRQFCLKERPDKYMVNKIFEYSCQNMEISQIQCNKRQYKLYEYIDTKDRRSKIYYRRKMIRKFYLIVNACPDKVSITETFTAILYNNMQLYLNEIQTGKIRGPFLLKKPLNLSFESQFKISKNGLFAYYDHYLMEDFKIVKFSQCSFVQFKEDSQKVVLYDEKKHLSLLDLINYQTLFIIGIQLAFYSDLQYYNFEQHFFIEYSQSFSCKYQLNTKSQRRVNQ